MKIEWADIVLVVVVIAFLVFVGWAVWRVVERSNEDAARLTTCQQAGYAGYIHWAGEYWCIRMGESVPEMISVDRVAR